MSENQEFIQPVQYIKNSSLSMVIEKYLKKQMLTGFLQPGDRINETALSERFSISRAPIREACRKLEEYGLLESKVGRGCFVRSLSFDQILELYDIRELLDGFAAEKASELRSRKQINKMQNLINQMESLATKKNTPNNEVKEINHSYLEANLAFHSCIVEISGNSSFIKLYESVAKRLWLGRSITLSDKDQIDISYQDHKMIFEAIVNQNRNLSGDLARQHIRKAKDRLISLRQKLSTGNDSDQNNKGSTKFKKTKQKPLF